MKKKLKTLKNRPVNQSLPPLPEVHELVRGGAVIGKPGHLRVYIDMTCKAELAAELAATHIRAIIAHHGIKLSDILDLLPVGTLKNVSTHTTKEMNQLCCSAS